MPRLSECLRILRARGFAEVVSPGDEEVLRMTIAEAI